MIFDIAYAVDDMSNLRYYIPLYKKVQEFFPESKQILVYKTNNFKYNGLGSQTNLDRFKKICEDNGNICEGDINSNVSCHTLISIEFSCMHDGIKHDHYVSLTHGFDSILHYAGKLEEFCDTYVCDEMFADHEKLKNVNKIHPPIPISMLLANEYQDTTKYRIKDKIATVLYPDLGLNHFADDVVEKLDQAGYHVYIKQRSKWQGITSKMGQQIYDRAWFPPESIQLPIISDVTIGFGSTAYIDLVPCEIPYVNVDIRRAEYPWNQMLHPKCNSYFHVMTSDIDEIAEVALKTKMKVINFDPADQKKIEEFICRHILKMS